MFDNFYVNSDVSADGHSWATAAITLVALANFIAVAHLARSERMIQELRTLCEKNGIEYGED